MKKHALTILFFAAFTIALWIKLDWRHDQESFRGVTHHPTLTPSDQADRLVEQIEFLRSKGIDPVREDFDIGQGWEAPSDWTGPPDWDFPEWWP